MHLIIDHNLLYNNKGAEVLTPTQMIELHTVFGDFIAEGGRITVLCPENAKATISESTLITQFADKPRNLELGTFKKKSLEFLENMKQLEKDTIFATANKTRSKQALDLSNGLLEPRYIDAHQHKENIGPSLNDTMIDIVMWEKNLPILKKALKV